MEKREIKFRAWNGKQMLNGEQLVDIPLLISPANGNILNPKDYSQHFGNIILMQFTGLKDNNLKEIYEGDIMYVAGVGNVLVEFISGCFGYKDLISFYPLYDDQENDIEKVIGNKFENPELLKWTN